MEEFEDFPTTPRSDEELERCADELRSLLGFGRDDCPSVSNILARAEARLGVEVVVKPDEQMGDREAYATSDPPRIFVRKSVFEAGERDEPRSRMTFVHEIVHIVLHPGAPKARMAAATTPKST